jgi:hypothetical protein
MTAFEKLSYLLARKATLQADIEATLAELPQVATPELTEFERCKYRGQTPEGLVCKISDSGVVFDVWHDHRYFGRFRHDDAVRVFQLATMERAVA